MLDDPDSRLLDSVGEKPTFQRTDGTLSCGGNFAPKDLYRRQTDALRDVVLKPGRGEISLR